MAELEIVKVDAFTEEPFTGNPANVVFDADDLNDTQMQRIASEAGSASTAFVLRSKKADVRLRFFSPYSEDPICGHSALGALWCLAERQAFGAPHGGRHRLETAIGILPFSVDGDADGPRRIWMTQSRPMFAQEGDVKEVASALGVGADALFHDRFPMSRASTGLPFLLVPVRSIEIIERLEPRREELTQLAKDLDVAGFEVYTWSVLDEGSAVHVRCFLPLPDIPEDPASGLPAGALGAYLAENEFVPRERFGDIVVEQGHWVGRPSKIHVRIEKRGPSIRKVEVGGSARTTMRGKMAAP